MLICIDFMQLSFDNFVLAVKLFEKTLWRLKTWISNMVSFTFSMIKHNVAPSVRPRFHVKLICCIGFEIASTVCCLLKSVATSL